MPIFSTKETLPPQERYEPPKYEEGSFLRSLLGYDRRGKRNWWGKITSAIIPGAGVIGNAMAQATASEGSDTLANIKDQTDDEWARLKGFVDVGATVANAFVPGVGTAISSGSDAIISPLSSQATAEEELRKKQAQYKQFRNMDSTSFRFGGKMRKYGDGGLTEALKRLDLTDTATSGAAGLGGTLDLGAKALGDITGLIGGLASGQFGADLSNDSEKHLTYNYRRGGGMRRFAKGGVMQSGDFAVEFSKGVNMIRPKGMRYADGGEPSMIYADHDEREDIVMFDKETGRKVGEMRYDERIFSQKDNIVMEALAETGLIAALGAYTATAIKRHEKQEEAEEVIGYEEECEDCMKEGGLTAEKARTMLHDKTANGRPLTDKQRRYFGWVAGGRHAACGKMYKAGGMTRNEGWPPVGVLYGIFNKDNMARLSEGASSPSESLKPRDIHYDNMTFRPSWETQLHQMAMNDRPETEIGEEQATVTGKVTEKGNPTTGGLTDYSMRLKGNFNLPETSEGKMSTSDWLGTASDALGAVYGAVAGSTPPPQWDIPTEFTDYVESARQEAQRGLSPAELVNYENQLNKTFDANIGAIRSVAQSASPGATLAAIRQAAAQRQQGVVQGTLLNENVRRQNRAAYAAVLPTAVQYDRMQYMDKARQYEQQESANLALLDASLQSISDRAQFVSAYGAGSSYEKYLRALGDQQSLYADQLRNVMLYNGFTPMQTDMLINQ